MLIPRRTVRTSQPQHPAAIDGQFARNLIYYSEASIGYDPLNPVGIITSNVSVSIQNSGKCFSFSSTDSYIHLARKIFANKSKGTLFFKFRKTAFAANQILIYEAASGFNNFAVKSPSSAASPLGVNLGSNTDRNTTKTTWNVNQEYSIGITFGSEIAIYVDGILDSTHAVSTPLGESAQNTSISGFWFADNNKGQYANADMEAIRFFDVAFSARQMLSLHDNPHQIFEDEEDYLFIPDASGGGSVSLIVADALHGHAVDSPSFSMATYLAVAESLHTQAADNLTLNTTGSANLAIQEAAHAHVSDGVALTTRWLLIVADALHTHAADNLTTGVTGATTLTVADATSVHTADSVALSVIAFLAIADAVSQHAADNLTLDTSNATFLTVQEATHSHGTDGIALTLDTWLAIVDAAHAHTADAPTLSLGQLSLQIADALHAMYSDIVFLTLPGGNLTTDQKFIIRATARRLAAIGLARNNIINRRAS